jgi:hypothetical protein
LAFYDDKFDDERPESLESNPFKDFLAITHDGQLANSSYTKLDIAATLLHNYTPLIPVVSATAILSPEEGGSRLHTNLGNFPSSEIAGISIMNVRCVTVEMISEKSSLTCC